jgi:hypothetical protein
MSYLVSTFYQVLIEFGIEENHPNLLSCYEFSENWHKENNSLRKSIGEILYKLSTLILHVG